MSRPVVHTRADSYVQRQLRICSFSSGSSCGSLNIRVQYWITKKGMDDYFGVQDKFLLGIKKDFEKAGIEMAFPTQTIHVKQ